MKSYIITTENTADLPASFLEEKGIYTTSLTYTIDGETYDETHPLSSEDFYEKMRAGYPATTSQVNPTKAQEFFQKVMDENHCDILHISFSSAQSGTYNSVRLAAEELEEDGAPHKVWIFDSLGASLGQGLMVYYALKNRDAGMSLEENLAWLTKHRCHFIHSFTVDDLHHLHQSGRLSKATAVIGSLVNLKPLLHADNEGRLCSQSTLRGRKKALRHMVENMAENLGSFTGKNEIIFISHADCEEDAKALSDMIQEKLGFTNFLIAPIGPTIGAHAGPGSLALFYLGEER